MESSIKTGPLVSICIPLYNAETTITRTLQSVLGQTYRNMEIIIVDNLSTDRTLERVREFVDSRVRVVENPVHFRNGEDNWNTCFDHARGEFIALFHADDLYSPDMVSRQVETFDRFPSVGGVFTNGDIIDEQDNVISTLRLPPGISGDTPYSYRNLLPAILEHENFLLCSSAMIRADIYRKTAPFRFDLFGHSSDLDMWLRISKISPVLIIDDNLLKYRTGRTGWSFSLRSRTGEGDGFRMMDSHVAESERSCGISKNTLARYELRKMEDQIFRAMNFLKKHDFSGFRQHFLWMPWGKYLRIILFKPWISIPVLVRGFFRMVKKTLSQDQF